MINRPQLSMSVVIKGEIVDVNVRLKQLMRQ